MDFGCPHTERAGTPWALQQWSRWGPLGSPGGSTYTYGCASRGGLLVGLPFLAPASEFVQLHGSGTWAGWKPTWQDMIRGYLGREDGSQAEMAALQHDFGCVNKSVNLQPLRWKVAGYILLPWCPISVWVEQQGLHEFFCSRPSWLIHPSTNHALYQHLLGFQLCCTLFTHSMSLGRGH